MCGCVILAYGMTIVIKSKAGTVICMVLVGPIAGKFLPVNEKMIKKILKSMNV